MTAFLTIAIVAYVSFKLDSLREERDTLKAELAALKATKSK